MPLAGAACLVGQDGWGDGRLSDYHGSGVLLNDFGLIEEFGGFEAEPVERLARLHALGVSVRAVSADLKPLPEPSEGELVRLGRLWVADGNSEARTGFLERITHLLKTGQATRVIDDGHLLLGEVSDPSSPVVPELTLLIQKARDSLLTEMG